MHFDARAASVSPSRMMFAVGLAELFEAGAIYLVGSGLGARVMNTLHKPININVFEPPVKQVQLPPPPQTQFVKPSLPTVSRPTIDVQTPPASNPIASQSDHPTGTQPSAAVPAQPAARNLPAATLPSGIAATHTQPPYPMLARRIGEQGTVVLSITVGADGIVESASVAKSSGRVDLDQAAASWVKDHWKYRPASRNGEPIMAQIEAQVVFDLNQSR
jgi:protein TonB